MRRWLLVVGMLLVLLVGIVPVSAHALPVRIEPPSNIPLDEAPAEIHMWFSEPLEPQFSKILLRDSNGNILNIAPSQVNSTDPTQMSLATAGLPDGLYTVVWRALSAADGHATLGSYPLVIGNVAGGFGASSISTSTDSGIPLTPTIARWANLFSLALGVGGLGFFLFVWRLAVPQKFPEAERRMRRVIWIGWVLIGVSGFLLLLVQYGVATGDVNLSSINGDSLNGLVTNTRFGHLWLARMALWAGLGGALWFARTDSWFDWVALIIGAVILVINSVNSHADAARDQLASIAADWLHLVAMAIWVGGLVQFFSVIGLVRREQDNSTATLDKLVGHFSNFARVSVAALAVTGLYLAWLDVGSIDGLFTTVYGQALLVKIILFIPVFAIAGFNLIYTHRGLRNGQPVWGSRLRKLVGAEITLTVGMLFAVGIMTSSYPSRLVLDQLAANPPAPQPQPFTGTQNANDLNVALNFTPGWIGNNDFTLTLTDKDGKPINDATLVRMKFDDQTKNLGESELRPALTGDGVYTISGANLSVPGDWRVRVTIQRPNQYDTLVDFLPKVPAAPEPPPVVPPPDPNAPLPNRVTILLFAGVAALAIGGFFLGENRLRPLRLSALLSLGLLVVGILFLASSMEGTATPTVSAAQPPVAFQPPPSAPVRLAVTSNISLPYLVTEDARLLQPGSDNQWHDMGLDAKVRDAYIDGDDVVWAATDSGLYTYKNGQWSQQSTLPVSNVDSMHGYVFALGDTGDITRVPAGGIEIDTIRQLKTPLANQKANDLVMLGDHSHILQDGNQLYQSPDLGLSWEPISAPQPIDSISTDTDGNLLATQDNGLATWNFSTSSWGVTIPLPGNDPHPVLRPFNDHLYALGGGNLYLQVGSQWKQISLPDSDGAYLDSLEFQYPRTFWVLDSQGSRLWSTENGTDWTQTKITVSS